jgi:transcriptional regulator with XRE-family HTH domain
MASQTSPRLNKKAHFVDPHFGYSLRKARHHAGLSLRELGELAGVCHATIAEFETAKCRPSLGTVVRLASALGSKDSEMEALLHVYLQSSKAGEIGTGLVLEAFRSAGLDAVPMHDRPNLVEVKLGNGAALVVESKGVFKR